ncbi:MAG: NAD(P)H-dependent oxidoreductase [Candidatus Poseidoniaceae archaeon]|nr:NAD(P)H-dependent oxidoreductase [Candidatus Poseidoniaceae archaeon]
MGTVLVIAASDGKNLVLAKKWVEVGTEFGYTMDILELCADELPLYTPRRDDEGSPVLLQVIEQRMAAADAWVICAPEYNGSIPPTLNNTIAWLSTKGEDFRGLFNGRPVGLSTHSGGGGQGVIAAMRMQFSYLGSNVVGRSVISNKTKEANPDAMRFILEQLSKLS